MFETPGVRYSNIVRMLVKPLVVSLFKKLMFDFKAVGSILYKCFLEALKRVRMGS